MIATIYDDHCWRMRRWWSATRPSWWWGGEELGMIAREKQEESRIFYVLRQRFRPREQIR